MTIEISYGCLFDSIEAQVNKQGYTLGKEAERMENIRCAITTCMFSVATDAQTDSMFEKLNRMVIKALKPLEDTK